LPLLVSLAAALAVATARVAWERDYRTVTVAMSYADLHTTGVRGVSAAFLELGVEECAHLEGVRTEGLALVVLLQLEPQNPALTTCLETLKRMRPWALAPIAEGSISREEWNRLSGFLEAQRPLLALVEFHAAPFALWAYRSGYRNLVRAHLIEREELEKLAPHEALARWLRAVREREVRLLLVYPPEAGKAEYLRELAHRLEREGFTLGLIERPREFNPPTPLLMLIALGPLGLAVMGCSRIGWRQGRCWAWLGAAPVPLFVIGFLVVPTMARLALAWLIAVLMPVLAHLFFSFPAKGTGLSRGLLILFAFSGMAVLGGLWVGTLLAGTEFFLKIYQFRGVKAALVLPILIPLFRHLRRHGMPCRPGPVGIVLLLLSGVIIVLAIARSDNLTALVSGVELRFRELLESLFYARPRFKEFLIGHPALLIWGARGTRSLWGAVLLGLGLLGQVSIINSFAHLHTPLLFSFLRTANGLALGLALGIGIYLFLRGGERLWRGYRLKSGG